MQLTEAVKTAGSLSAIALLGLRVNDEVRYLIRKKGRDQLSESADEYGAELKRAHDALAQQVAFQLTDDIDVIVKQAFDSLGVPEESRDSEHHVRQRSKAHAEVAGVVAYNLMEDDLRQADAVYNGLGKKHGMTVTFALETPHADRTFWQEKYGTDFDPLTEKARHILFPTPEN